MRDFQNLVADVGVNDLSQVGRLFTWWNKRQRDPIGKKLDRALINGEWLSCFPNSYATFEAGGISDHARCLVRLTQPTTGPRKPFKFFNFLTEHEQFLSLVAQTWNEQAPLYHSRSALYRFHKHLKRLKFNMRMLNRTKYGDLPVRTREAYEVLCDKQNQALLSPSETTLAEASTASDRWHHLAYVEEKFFKQKSCIKWLSAGDQNTKFFHRAATCRAARNSIKYLESESGVPLTSLSDIKKEAVSYFQRFLQVNTHDAEEVSLESLQDTITYRCSGSSCAKLVAPVTSAEIQSALHSLPNDKVSGPDGYTKEFYVSAWPVIGRDFITAVQSFFLFGFLPTGVNSTILSLIPKSESAKTMKDYRPIACCNLLYKVISKILANRLKVLLPDAIEPNQCAFLKGRLLMENVLLASELVNGYHKTTISSRCTIKFDIAKAFDTVKWSFIVEVLRTMGLPDLFITWIHTCISTASFSVAVNGELEGFFTSARGIRQGCSLSPYLYVILSNVLSKLLNNAAAEERFGYHPMCKEVALTHLSFADDILVFSDGTTRSLAGIMYVLNGFASMSGLHINASKSTIFTPGSDYSELSQAAADLGISRGSLPIRYLGLPLTTKSLAKADYEPLIDRIRSRFLSWNISPLSYAGRLQLIKSVIASITNFWSSVFILPKSCLEEIERMSSAFLWSGSPSNTHKAKVSWDEVCAPKSEGGLGLRKLRDTSRVYALNLIWRLFTLSGSLWVAWTRHYLLKYESIWDVREGTKGSWVWKKLLKIRDQAYNFIGFQVKDGKNTFFWFDDWLQEGKLLNKTGVGGTRILGVPRNAKVADAASHDCWCVRSNRARYFQSLLAKILNMPVPHSDRGPDQVLWKHSDGNFHTYFSSAKTWEQIRKRNDRVSWFRVVWFPQAVPRHSFMTWLTVRNRLSTGDRMRSWGIQQSCLLCGERDETRDHLFFACPFSFTLWLALAEGLMGSSITPDWNLTLAHIVRLDHSSLDAILLKMVLQTTIYNIWQERNYRRHHQPWRSHQKLAWIIDKAIRNRISSLRYNYQHRFQGLLQRWFGVYRS